VLDVQGGCITDVGAGLLAASPDLKHLEFLNLSRNALTGSGTAALRKTGVKVNVSAQHGVQADDDEDGYLFEGDIE
jgi:hypothetical protein